PPAEGEKTLPPEAAAGTTLAQPRTADTVTAAPAELPQVPGYEVLEELGRGGMGVVYKARHRVLNRLVALKMILGGAYVGAESLERFRTEAEAIARLDHPNIVQVYELGERDGLPYFALEFCGGRSLERRIKGTPSYMAPEQARGDVARVGPAADIYALGAVLYECLTGRAPFRGATALETILQVERDEPVSPRRLNPRVPRDLETVCLKCLRKQPEKRYATADAL